MALNWDKMEEPCVVCGEMDKPETWRFADLTRQVTAVSYEFFIQFESKTKARNWVLDELSKRQEVLKKAMRQWELMGRSKISNHPFYR